MSLLDPVSIVLVRSQYESNVGAAARAMANMGFSRLVLIAPHCQLGYAARQSAACAQDILENCVAYTNFTEFWGREGAGLRFGFTRRSRGHRELLSLPDALDFHSGNLAATGAPTDHDTREPASAEPVYLFFGPENDSLSNQETQLCHELVCLPSYGETASYNLAQAVLIALYQLRQWLHPKKLARPPARERAPQPEADKMPMELLHQWLRALGYQLDDRHENAHRAMLRLLLRQTPRSEDLALLNGVLQQALRKLAP